MRQGDLRLSFVRRISGKIALDRHVLKLMGIEDLPAFQALYILGIVFPGYYADSGMFALSIHEGALSGRCMDFRKLYPTLSRCPSESAPVHQKFAGPTGQSP
jgi:hypothetical protein